MVSGRKDGDKAKKWRKKSLRIVVCLCSAGELVKPIKSPQDPLLAFLYWSHQWQTGRWNLIKGQLPDPTSAPIRVSTAHVLIALRLRKCCRGNRMEMGIIMYSWCRRPGGCGPCSQGTALYPEPDVSGQNHSTQDSSRILRSHDRMEGGREWKRQGKKEDKSRRYG